MAEFHTAAIAVSEVWPITFGKVIDFIDHVSVLIFNADEFTAIPQAALPITDCQNGSVGSGKVVNIGCDHEIVTRCEGRAGWKVKAHSVGDSPAGKIHALSSAVVEFNVFPGPLIRGGVVHDLVDYDGSLTGRRIVGGIFGVSHSSKPFLANWIRLESLLASVAVQTRSIDDRAAMNEEDVYVSIFISGKSDRETDIASGRNASGKIHCISEGAGGREFEGCYRYGRISGSMEFDPIDIAIDPEVNFADVEIWQGAGG